MEKVIPYVGAKYRWVYSRISEMVKQDEIYIEPFGGGFSLGLNLLEQGKISKAIYNDLDKDVFNFWMCLKTDVFRLIEQCDSKLINNIDIDNSEYNKAANYYIDKQSNNKLEAFSYTDTFIKANKLLENVEILNLEYKELKKYDSNKTFWYMDPPYAINNAKRYYKVLNNKDFEHEELKEFVQTLKGRVIISYNGSQYIRELFKDFKQSEIVGYANSVKCTELFIEK